MKMRRVLGPSLIGGLSNAGLSVSVFLMLLLLIGCQQGGDAGGTTTEVTDVPRNVRVVTVEPIDLDEYLLISGSAAPLHGTDLSSEESGRVAAIPNDKGSHVLRGNTLIELDRRLLAAEKQSAEANRDLSAFNEDRVRKLYEAESVSEIEMLEAETQFRQTDALAKIARLRYERAAIAAPFEGIVTDRYVELGQLVGPGTPVARVVNPFILKLEGAVTEREIAYVREGSLAIVSFDGVPDPVEGYVHWVSFEASPQTGKFDVEIRIENPDLALRPGVVAKAQVMKRSHGGVIAIPRDAVLQRADGPSAFIVEETVARERRLRLGSDQGLMVIVEEGLTPGDQVVVRGQREIHDGSAIRIQEEATSPDGTLGGDPKIVTQAEIEADKGNAPTERAGEDR
jgi:membrane fusion protein (multidrug efflux system)